MKVLEMGISRKCLGTKSCNIQKPHIPTFSTAIKIVLEPTSESSWFRNQKPGYLKGWRLASFIVHPLAFLVRQYDVENKGKKVKINALVSPFLVNISIAKPRPFLSLRLFQNFPQPLIIRLSFYRGG